MYSIYCLIDPRDNKPFYIGATSYSLKARLSQHISSVDRKRSKRFSLSNDRKEKIKDILKCGHRIIIKLIRTATLANVNRLEFFYYKKYTKLGFNLLQSDRHFSFPYHKLTEHVGCSKSISVILDEDYYNLFINQPEIINLNISKRKLLRNLLNEALNARDATKK